MVLNVELLRPLLWAAWGRDTCDPVGREHWRPDNPARGQCGTTALVVQDLLGGDLILGEVHVGGAKVWNHYWNRLPDGAEVDLTSDQFHPDEVVAGGRIQPRPPDAPRRCREEYELLRQRVLTLVAREYGIPAVVGVPHATNTIETAVVGVPHTTDTIETGQTITVDGTSGAVTA